MIARSLTAVAVAGVVASCATAPPPVIVREPEPAPPSASASSTPATLVVKIIERGTDIQGRLPPQPIKTLVRQNFVKFRACYLDGLARDKNLTGLISVTFIIGPTGGIESAKLNATSTLPDNEVRQCVLGVFRQLTFPEPEENGKVLVTYPLEFVSGAE